MLAGVFCSMATSMTISASPTGDQQPPTPCPKCRSDMLDVAVTPHPLIPQMRRHTFVCYTCNQTRTYMLPAA
jgi:hypothetical protein